MLPGRPSLVARDLLRRGRPQRDDHLDRPLRRLRQRRADPPVLQQDSREPRREPKGARHRGRSRERRPVRARPPLPSHRERGADLRRRRGEPGCDRLPDGDERHLPPPRSRHPPRRRVRAVRRDGHSEAGAACGPRHARPARRVRAEAVALRRVRGSSSRRARGARRPLRLRFLDPPHPRRARRPALRGGEQRLRRLRSGRGGADRGRDRRNRRGAPQGGLRAQPRAHTRDECGDPGEHPPRRLRARRRRDRAAGSRARAERGRRAHAHTRRAWRRALPRERAGGGVRAERGTPAADPRGSPCGGAGAAAGGSG